MSLMPGYLHQSAFYPILVSLVMDGSVADRSTSCKQFSNPATETTVFRGGGCFLLSRGNRTWEESKTFCESLADGWSLVVIEDTETQKHVDNLTLTAAGSSAAWIGLQRGKDEYGYKWVSGNDLGNPSFFRNLADGESASPGYCVTTSPPEGNTIYGTWDYAECETRRFSICHTNSGSLHQRTTRARQITTSATTASTTSTSTSTLTQSTIAAKTQTTVTATRQITSATTPTTISTTTPTPTTPTTPTPTSSTTAAKAQTTVKDKTGKTQSVATVATSSSTGATKPSVQARPLTDSIPRTSTKPTVQTTPFIVTNNILIPVTSGVAVVAAVAVFGVVIFLCRRNKAKRLRVRTIETGDDRESGDVRTKPEVVYAAVIPRGKKESTQAPMCDADPSYHYIPLGGEDSAGQGVLSDQMYDTTTAIQEKQQLTLDSTYDRAMFHQTGDDVYDHTCLTRKSPQAQDTSHYDHVVYQ